MPHIRASLPFLSLPSHASSNGKALYRSQHLCITNLVSLLCRWGSLSKCVGLWLTLTSSTQNSPAGSPGPLRKRTVSVNFWVQHWAARESGGADLWAVSCYARQPFVHVSCLASSPCIAWVFILFMSRAAEAQCNINMVKVTPRWGLIIVMSFLKFFLVGLFKTNCYT